MNPGMNPGNGVPATPQLLVGVIQHPNGTSQIIWNGITPKQAIRILLNAIEDLREQPTEQPRVVPVSGILKPA